MHDRGVCALQALPAGALVLDYRGELMSWETATEADAHADVDTATYYFDRGDGTVIDGARGGNSTRFLDHSCDPNCEAVLDAGRHLRARQLTSTAGVELFLDYALQNRLPEQPRGADPVPLPLRLAALPDQHARIAVQGGGLLPGTSVAVRAAICHTREPVRRRLTSVTCPVRCSAPPPLRPRRSRDRAASSRRRAEP